MRGAVIDIGSHSIKLIIGETRGERMEILESLKSIVPIANDTFQKGRVSSETVNQAVTVLEKYRRVLADYEVTDVRVIATTAVREAENRDVFTDMIKRRTGLETEVLTVGDIIYYIDAYLSQELAESYPVHEKNLLIAEIGSGSLDISVVRRGMILAHAGLPLGTLRLRKLMNDLDEGLQETVATVREHVANEFASLGRYLPPGDVDDVLLIDENFSGHLPALLSRKKGDSRLSTVTKDEAGEILAQVMEKTPPELSRAARMPQELAESAVPFGILLAMFFTLTRNESLSIVDISLAEAVLGNMLLSVSISRKYGRTNQLISVAEAVCEKYRADPAHARQVARLAEAIFAGVREECGLKRDALLYLVLAAYLHDIGTFVQNRSHHKHSEYLISSMNLTRLHEEEVKVIACVSRYHRRAFPSENHPLFNSLAPERRILVQKLSAILRIANALDRSHRQKVGELTVKVDARGGISLVVRAAENLGLERADFAEKKALFEEITGSRVTLSVTT